MLRAEDKDVGNRRLVRRYGDCVVEYGRRCFWKNPRIAIFIHHGREASTLRLVESLRKRRLTWSGGTSFWSNLCPAFSEKIAKLPARLDSRSEELFVCLLALTLVLTETEQHLC